MVLKGKKVTLRAIEESDLEMLKDLMNDPEAGRTTVGMSFPISSRHQKRWYEEYVVMRDDPIRLIIETEKDGAVGTVILGDFDWINRVAHNCGIKVMQSRITESGIALDAVNTLFRYAFDELNLNRIDSEVLDFNEQSLALNRLLGMEYEGRKRQAVFRDGEYHDLIMLSMLREDFKEGARRVRKRAQNNKELF